MADGISPIGLANTGIPAQQPEAGAMDFLKSTPLGIALLQGGLSALSGTNVGQAFGQGLGTYQQLMAGQQQQEQQALDTGLKERQVAVSEGELARKTKEDERRAKLAEKKLKAMAEKVKAPKGVNEKLWKEARETVAASLKQNEFGEPEGELSPISVFQMYNQMVGDEGEKAYMRLGSKELGSLFTKAQANPEFADLFFNEAGSIYGPKQMEKVKMRWQAMQEKGESQIPEASNALKSITSQTPVPLTGNYLRDLLAKPGEPATGPFAGLAEYFN